MARKELLPYEHELSANGTGCSLRCPACQYANDLRAESPPQGAISKYRWMEEQAKLPKPENAPKPHEGAASARYRPPPTRGGTCPACGDWDCGRHNP
jgi:hypothetical protein